MPLRRSTDFVVALSDPLAQRALKKLVDSDGEARWACAACRFSGGLKDMRAAERRHDPPTLLRDGTVIAYELGFSCPECEAAVVGVVLSPEETGGL